MNEYFEILEGTNYLAPRAVSQGPRTCALMKVFRESEVEERLDENIDEDSTRIEDVDQVRLTNSGDQHGTSSPINLVCDCLQKGFRSLETNMDAMQKAENANAQCRVADVTARPLRMVM